MLASVVGRLRDVLTNLACMDYDPGRPTQP
jgi:hypothetical protein